MGAGAGVALKFLQWFNRGVQFCCAAVVLGLYSYFLATLQNHNLPIANWVKAVEGISGIAVVYTAIGLLLLCCLAGLTLTSFLAIALDLCFVAAFIYVASANRGGAGSCIGHVDTPFGRGSSDDIVSDNGNGGFTSLPTFYQACKMETACLAVSIVAIFFFIFSAATEFALARHHKREKRFGPSPANNYTAGSGKRRGLFAWRRNKGDDTMNGANVLPEHTHPDQVRDSYATEATAVGTAPGREHNKHGEAGLAHEQPAVPANYQYDDGTYTRGTAV